MTRTRFRRAALALAAFLGAGFAQGGPDAVARLDTMLQAAGRVKSLRFRLKDYERVKGKIKIGEESVKMNLHPLRLYFYVEAPAKGAEVLWREGENHGDAWVHPDGFPYYTLNLDPFGKYMRTGHHSMFESAPGYFAGLLANTRRKLGDKFPACLKDEGPAEFDGRPCRKLTLENPGFGYVAYTAGAGENVDSLAKKFNAAPYLILEKNPELKGFGAIAAGRKLLVPTDYALKTTFLIDDKTHLPLVEWVYDDKGLFEKYEYSGLETDLVFQDRDFARDNPAYHF